MRHRRHHPALHQVQLPGEGRRRPAAGAARGVLCRRERPARAGGGRHPEGHPVRARRLQQAERVPAQGLPAEARRRRREDQGGGRADAGRQARAVLHRRRRHQFRAARHRAAARAGAAHRLPRHLDLDGPRRHAGDRSAVARHARHARHLRGEPRDARLRRDGLRRRAVRRPHHRPARRVLAGLEEDPHRHRPVLDQQERQGRHPDHRRLRPCARGHARRRGRPARRVRPGRQDSMVGADRALAGEEKPRLSDVTRRDQAAICDPAAATS